MKTLKWRNLLSTIATIFLITSITNAQCTTTIFGDTLVCNADQIILSAHATGPGQTLQASSLAGNNHRGNMFDIIATNAVEILSFDASPMGNTTIEIYYKVGTWNGFANTPSAWTFIGSAPITYTGGFVPTNIPVNIVIPAGETYAFYVTSSNTSVSLNYSNGTNVGNVYSSDANISFIEGGGLDYPFTAGTGSVYQPRIWNGNINYALVNLPTSYLWDTGETTPTITSTITAATTFSVEATVQGCPPASDEITLSLSTPIITTAGSTSICLGDSAIIYGMGASTYSWDNNIEDSIYFTPTNMGTIDYIVTGIDSLGCSATATAQLVVNALPDINAGSDLNICQGNSATLTATGAETYIWNNDISNGIEFTPTESGTFVVTGTNAYGCQRSDTLILTLIPQAPVIVSTLGIQIISNAANSYQWINCSTNTQIQGATEQTFTPSENGSYAVVVENEYGCIDTSACVQINSVGINQANFADFTISPNPTSGKFKITTTNMGDYTKIEIYNTLGQLQHEQTFNGTELIVDLSMHDNGVYLLKMNDNHIYRILKK